MNDISEQYIDCHDAEILGLAWDNDTLRVTLRDYQDVLKALVLSGLTCLRVSNLSGYNIVGDNEISPVTEASENFWRFLLWDSPNPELFTQERTRILESVKDGCVAVYFDGSVGVSFSALCTQLEWKLLPS